MLSPSDSDYKLTSNVKLGLARMQQQFEPLAELIEAKYHQPVLNILLEEVGPDKLQRLQIVFERESARQTFLNADGFCDTQRQVAIAKAAYRLGALVARKGDFVIFSSFEPIARAEAVGKISAKEQARLIAALEGVPIWTFSIFLSYVTVMLETCQNVQESEARGWQAACRQAIQAAAQQHDRFGYIAETPVWIAFDSRENFEKNYQGNWQYFYK